MKLILMLVLLLFALHPIGFAQSETPAPEPVYPALGAFIDSRIAEFGEIDPERKELLNDLSDQIAARIRDGEAVRLTFICTHNSRRSHMAQVWAGAAAAHFAIPHMQTYSGGTESTAFNPRAVEALRRAGFNVQRTTGDRNPIYHVRINDDAVPTTHFSKVYDVAPNPSAEYLAIMVCSDADEACPIVAGADGRFAIPYVDPKAFDGTTQEAAKYDERCRQIAREMLYVFSRVGR